MEKKSRGFPNLDKYLNERSRKLVNYKEGAEIFVVAFVIVGGGNLPSKPKKHVLILTVLLLLQGDIARSM